MIKRPIIRNTPHTSRAGFTLIELSIVIAILGILTVGALTVGGTMVEQQRYIGSNERVEQARAALEDFFRVNGRLPCVAPNDIAIGAAGYGAEIASCETGVAATGSTIRIRRNGVACTALAADLNCVRVGALPVRTLGLPDAAAADEYGNKLIYAVTEQMTSVTPDVPSNATARVNILDGTGTLIADGATTGTGATGAAFSVVSTGPEGKGAYKLLTGTRPVTCTAGSLDTENCDGDATFVDTQFSNGTIAANFYDDIPTWTPKYLLTTSTVPASNLWLDSGSNIYAVGSDNDLTTGNVGIGTSTPASKLDIEEISAATPSVLLRLTQTRGETSGTLYVQDNAVTYSPVAVSSAALRAFRNQCIINTTVNLTNATRCQYNVVSNHASSTGTRDSLIGNLNEAENNSNSGTIDSIYGNYNLVQQNGTSTINSAFGTASVIQNLAGGTITNATGVYGRVRQGNIGSITNASGVNGNAYIDGTLAIGSSIGVEGYVLTVSTATSNINEARGGHFHVDHEGRGTISEARGLMATVDVERTTAPYGNITTAEAISANTRTLDNTGGTITTATGANIAVIALGDGDITTATGTLSRVNLDIVSTADITTATGALAKLDLDPGSTGSITTGYAFRTQVNDTGAGSVVTGYGVYIDNIAATTDWGIYQAGPDDDNIFNGRTIINGNSLDLTNVTALSAVNTGGGLVITNEGWANPAVAYTSNVMRIDNNDIQTASAGAAASLNINRFGGNVNIGNPLDETLTSVSIFGTTSLRGGVNGGLNIETGGVINTLPAGGTILMGSAGGRANLRVTGTVSTCNIGTGAGATNCTSDERLKTDIAPIENALEKITSLNGITYRWKDKTKPQTTYTGLLAQNVEKVFPDMVIEGEDGYKMLDYASLVSPLIESVKTLDAKNTALESRIAALEANLTAHPDSAQASNPSSGIMGLDYKTLTQLLAALLVGVFGTLLLRRRT